MPAKPKGKHRPGTGGSRGQQTPESQHLNDADNRSRRKLQKNAAHSPGALNLEDMGVDVESVPRQSSDGNPSARSNRGPFGARPLLPGSSKPRPSIGDAERAFPIHSSRQSSLSNASQFNFGTTPLDQNGPSKSPSEGQSFLPPVNFDDLQSSLSFGELGGGFDFGPSVERASDSDSTARKLSDREGEERKAFGTVTATAMPDATMAENKHRRSNSFIRPPSFSRPKNAENTRADNMGPPPTQTNKQRRLSQYSGSTSAGNSVRAPRKSVGPGILTNTSSDYPYLKGDGKPEGNKQGNRQSRARAPSGSQRASRHSLAPTAVPNTSHNRSVKAKSMQPPLKIPTDGRQNASTTPEAPFNSPNVPKSPGRLSQDDPSTPSSARRMSMVPGHATGLGARTISPTDARRLKRMSIAQGMGRPPVPNTPPASVPDTAHLVPTPTTVESPQLGPRKSATPSSNRTTPDLNRKSYSSGISISSNTSFSSVRNSTQQPRQQQTTATSRLPTLKGQPEGNIKSQEPGVPPVPAIPKAFESPKGEQDSPVLPIRKSSIAFDTASTNSSSTFDFVSTQSSSSEREKETPKAEKESKYRRMTTHNARDSGEERAAGARNGRRTMQPLALPPLNFPPLSGSTADRVASLQEDSVPSAASVSTPPPRKGHKTPTTPMTASKATFFSRHQAPEEAVPTPIQKRSSSSHINFRADGQPIRAPSSSLSSQPRDINPARKASASPFISSSLPKNSGEFARTLRSKASVDSSFSFDGRPSRLTGPRAQHAARTSTAGGEITEAAQNSPLEIDQASGIGNSIRRKLSITRRRSNSKVDQDQPPKPPAHESMPPPKLPASATMSGQWLPNPSPVQKPYLVSRRKSSAPETTSSRQERAKSEIFSGAAGEGGQGSRASIDARKPPPQIVNAKRSQSNIRRYGSNASLNSVKLSTIDTRLDGDDMIAEAEMNKLALRRKKTEQEARELDELKKRAAPRERVSPSQAIGVAHLNIYERGEIIDFKDIYFCGTRDAKKVTGNLEAQSANFGYDDDRGDYNIVLGDHLAYRYEVVNVLGKGSFGQVVRCVDHKTGGLVAVKIIRNKKRFHQQALVEVNILKKLREWDPHNKYSMVNFTHSFYFRGHLCISTELLGMNLYEFIKVHDFKGFSLKLIRRFTKQALNSLVLLQSKKVIHCDLKPENILLAHPAHSDIKVIDFGSSCMENEKVYTYIQSRFYRSPEVILGMSYGMPIDMWSLGCILAELYTGYPIFPGENEQEQLACIMEVFGPPDKHLIEKSSRRKLFFDSLGKPRLNVSSKGRRRRPSSKTLQQAIKCDDEPFLDFLRRCLRWDPDRRMKPDEATHHEFITGVKPTAAAAARGSSRAASSAVHSSFNASTSPVKRYHSVQVPAGRKLPDTPGGGGGGVPAAASKPTFASKAREVNIVPLSAHLSSAGGSPVKGPGTRRKSTLESIGLSNGFGGSASKRHHNSHHHQHHQSGGGGGAGGPSGPPPTSALPKLGGPRAAGSANAGGRGGDLASAAAAAAIGHSIR